MTFDTWPDVLIAFQKFNKNDTCLYMLATNKGAGNEARTRFMTYDEMLTAIMHNIEKSKL